MGTKPRFGQIGFYDTRPNGPSRVNLKVLGKKFKTMSKMSPISRKMVREQGRVNGDAPLLRQQYAAIVTGGHRLR